MSKLARPYRMAAVLTALCLAGVVGQADSQADVQAVTITKFASPGTDLPFVVPDGVTSIHVVAIGGMGGMGAHSPALGGFGAVVSGDIAVKPGRPCSSTSPATAATPTTESAAVAASTAEVRVETRAPRPRARQPAAAAANPASAALLGRC